MAGEVIFSVDVEHDAPPYLESWRGVEDGLPRLLNILDDLNIRATFFVTGRCCELFPEKIVEISRKHEVGCHGYLHERLDSLPFAEQFRRIEIATNLIEKTIGRRPRGFRAPNFRCNKHTYVVLQRIGYFYDSSQAVYRRGPDPRSYGLIEIENVWPSNFLRLPPAISKILMKISLATLRLTVLDYHPWELVKMEKIRWDCRFATGKIAEERLRLLLSYALDLGARFRTMEEIAKDLKRRVSNIY